MKIGLVDVDGHHFPNLALMKISAYHKALGDEVSFAGSLFEYDKIYMAKVFTFTEDDQHAYQAKEIVLGGTGYNLSNKLPTEIENIYPDYSLYNIENIAYGFLTRGCPRSCSFCIVAKKEGLETNKVADLKNFWDGQKDIRLLDPNILACDDWENLIGQLANSSSYIDFTQGLDIRLMTKEKQKILQQCKIKILHFAWDNPNCPITYNNLKIYRDGFNLDRRKLSVYVLTNYNTTFEQDLDRIYKLRELEYDPYVMIYNKQTAPNKIRYLQRWVNNKRIFQVINKFEDYDHKIG